jgi:FixJ family two-component response regulator
MATYLTENRKKVLQGLIDGKRTLEIAEEMGISHRTVESHYVALKKIYKANTLMQVTFLYCKEVFTGMMLMQKILNKESVFETVD